MLPKTKELLKKHLNIPKPLVERLPSRYQRVGSIVILKLKPSLERWKKEIGKVLLENLPSVTTVCRVLGVEGRLKKPILEVLAGDGTETIVKERGCLFKLDVSKIMFAKGNLEERHRIPKLVEKGETIVDMFAGIGYFSIPIAKFSNPKLIFAIDINPVAIKYLKENIKLNRVRKKIVPILGDCRDVARSLEEVADRVIMGFLPKTYKFLSSAFSFLKEEGTIHYHDTFKESELWSKPIEILRNSSERCGYKLLEILHRRIVKSYAPRVYHVVIDAKFKKVW